MRKMKECPRNCLNNCKNFDAYPVAKREGGLLTLGICNVELTQVKDTTPLFRFENGILPTAPEIDITIVLHMKLVGCFAYEEGSLGSEVDE